MRYNYFRCDAVLHATTAMLKRIDASVASGSVGASGQRRLGRQLIGPELVLPRKSAAGACVNIFWAVLPVGIMAGLLGVDQAAVGADRTELRQILSQVLPGQVLPGQVPAVPVPESQVPAVPIPAAPTATAPRAATPQLPYTLTYTSHLTVRADRTATDLFTRRLKILTPFALGLLSQQSATFVEGMETLETVEAFTEKPDGTKIPVDPANIITRDAATGLQATFARDLKQRTVIFQDVQVGDTLVWTGHKETLQGLFPGQFFYADLFPRAVPVASAEIVVEAPAELNLQVKAIGSAFKDRVEDAVGDHGDMRRHTITLEKRSFELPEERAVAPSDVDPLVLISTFKSYAEMGGAYAAAALPKATVTPEIAALAEEITKGVVDRRDQAMAIDAWIKKNVRYVAVLLAVGRVVPNDAASVLHNKFGDCKDKATLMSALLAAKGIASEQVLLNQGNAYTLPEPPTMVSLNHVMLYLPEFDLYDDPTVQLAAFGVLAVESYDKPVVRVSSTGAVLARIPAMKPEDHVASVHTTIAIARDGTLTGRTAGSGTGFFGQAVRAVAAAAQTVGTDNATRLMLAKTNTPGTGRFDIGSAAATSDPAMIEVSFTLNDKFRTPAPGGRASIPLGLSPTARPGMFLLGTRLAGRKIAFTCFAGRQIEEIEANFDPGLPTPVAPQPVKIENATFSYQATFRVEGRTLTAHREFVSHVDHQTCDPAIESKIAREMTAVLTNVNTNNYAFRRNSDNASTRPTPLPAAVATARPTEPKPGTAAPLAQALPSPAAPATLERKRFVAANHTVRLDFFYSIYPDCSSIGFATVRVGEQPNHGRIVVENGTSFTNFPANNPRVDCNKQRSDGVIVTYQPEPDYTGIDFVDLEVIYASGSFSKLHYAIEVK